VKDIAFEIEEKDAGRNAIQRAREFPERGGQCVHADRSVIRQRFFPMKEGLQWEYKS
jgi:hypothetical protein